MSDALTEGRAAFEREAWGDAYAGLSEADKQDPLAPGDLRMLAISADLIGKNEEHEELLTRAHGAYLDAGDVERAADCAFWLGLRLVQAGEQARGSGWLARAERLIDDADLDTPVRGLLLLPSALKDLFCGDYASAHATFVSAGEIGDRFDEPDLMTLARLGQGQSLIRMGETEEGVRLLDEVMVGVTAGDASPLIVGIVYCAVIESCHGIFDLRRAREWTAAFTRWCEARPDLVPFRGECLVRRAEIMQMHGEWSDAMEEARRAGEWLTQPPGNRAAGAAFYRQAELHRLRGRFGEAEKAFHQAGRWGRSPQPGLALLQLAQGKSEAACTSLRRALEEMPKGQRRAPLLFASVEVLLATDDVPAARSASEELSEIAAATDAPYLNALSAHADGLVLQAEGRLNESLDALRDAWRAWREIGAPYEAARAQVAIGLVCRTLDDDLACEMELEEARRTFERLNAGSDLARLDEITSGHTAPGGLTPREVEVLGLVATGKTNRAIAGELHISDKTVARHLSNIFSKLGVSSRAAATAYAYEHGLT